MSEVTADKLRDYLDRAIMDWRKRRDEAKTLHEQLQAACYLDAFQSCRKSLLGEFLPAGAGPSPGASPPVLSYLVAIDMRTAVDNAPKDWKLVDRYLFRTPAGKEVSVIGRAGHLAGLPPGTVVHYHDSARFRYDWKEIVIRTEMMKGELKPL